MIFTKLRVISPPASSLMEEPEPCLAREFAGAPCTTHGDATCVVNARLSAVSAAGRVFLAGTTRSGRAKSGGEGDEARRLVSLWKSAA